MSPLGGGSGIKPGTWALNRSSVRASRRSPDACYTSGESSIRVLTTWFPWRFASTVRGASLHGRDCTRIDWPVPKRHSSLHFDQEKSQKHDDSGQKVIDRDQKCRGTSV